MDVMTHLLEISYELANKAIVMRSVQALTPPGNQKAARKAVNMNAILQRKISAPGSKLGMDKPKVVPSLSFLRKYKNPLIAGGALATGVGGALLYKRMKDKKVQESASSCDFPTIAGPTPQDKRPIRGAQNALNSRKMSRKRKKLPLTEGVGGFAKKVKDDLKIIRSLSNASPPMKFKDKLRMIKNSIKLHKQDLSLST